MTDAFRIAVYYGMVFRHGPKAARFISTLGYMSFMERTRSKVQVVPDAI